MLTSQGCALRRQRFWKHLQPGCEVALISDPRHLLYFANYCPSPFVFRSADAGALLVLEPERSTLIGDNIAQPFLELSHVDRVITCEWYDGTSSVMDRRQCLIDAAVRHLAPFERYAVGVEGASVPGSVWEFFSSAGSGVMLRDLSPLIGELKAAKDDDEIQIIRRSIQAGEAGQAAALAQVEPGMTEMDVYLIVQEAAARALGHPAIVYGDFVSGPRCEIERGGPPSNRVIARGDLLLLDFSVVVHGYRGDFTNTFVVGALPTQEQIALYEACLGALRAGEALLKPGRPASEVDAGVRGHFARLGLDQFFTTHAGHGIGLGHPESPFIVPQSGDYLAPGNIVALEPGLYVPSVGGMRFEHNYLITEDGFETLTHHRLALAR
jgi:Xaa-Pro aminopeptidase